MFFSKPTIQIKSFICNTGHTVALAMITICDKSPKYNNITYFNNHGYVDKTVIDIIVIKTLLSNPTTPRKTIFFEHFINVTNLSYFLLP